MRRAHAVTSTLAALGLALSGCSLGGEAADDASSTPSGTSDGATGGQVAEVVLLTHDSFALPEEVVAQWEEETGYRLVQRASGDAGQLTNKLALSAGNPQGDVVFGIDNTFGSRAVEEGVLEPYEPELPAGAEQYRLPGDEEGHLTPVDTGSVCVNIDTTWFQRQRLEPPATLEDLADPRYRDLFAVPGAPTSSPGMAFLLATIAEYGDAWPDYWERLVANGAKITSGWEDAYYVEFTQGGGGGTRPIVLSYDSSPAFTVNDNGDTTTAALLDTCFRQVEYAGVLAGAENPDGARAVVDLLLSPEVQAALPTSMYVFPVDGEVELPADWARHAPQPEQTYEVDPVEVAEHRQEWLTTWTEIVSR